MKDIDKLALEVISDIVGYPDEYADATRDTYKDVVNQICGVLLLRDAVRGEEKREIEKLLRDMVRGEEMRGKDELD